MANEALKQFLIERLLDLDETLSDDEGSVMFTRVIDPVLKRLGTDPMSTDIETFILERLQDEFPNLDVNSPGSTLRDVLVSPLVLLLEPLRVEINHLRQQLSLSDSDALTNAEMDALLGNWFTTRDIGAYSYAIVRVYFSSPRTVGTDSSITFTTGDGIAFVPTGPKTFVPSDMKRTGNLYYIDVSVRSMQATSEANVIKGAIKFVNGLDGVVRVTNQAKASGGVTEETNEDFLTRAERSLSERSLNTKRGIETNIYNNFADIVSIDVVGFNEPDMQRDILQAETETTIDESVGPMVYTTAQFRTLPVISAGDGTEFPFTHTIRMYSVPVTEQAAIQAAEYIRVVDGNAYFNGKLLSRVREIEGVHVESPGVLDPAAVDIVIRTKDFEIYPPQASVTTPSGAGSLLTDDDAQGFNRHSRRGSEWVLYGNDAGTDKVTGAPLPFTDYIDASALSGTPTSVEVGRDFLVAISEGVASQWGNVAFPAMSNHIKTYPLDAYYTGNRLGISRVDSFLDSKSRVVYSGAATYDFQSDRNKSGALDTVQVLDFGAPDMVNTWTPAAGTPVLSRYDGITKTAYGRNAGVAIRGWDTGSTTVYTDVNITTVSKDVDVALHPSTTDWLGRGIAPGDYVCCTVFEDYDQLGLGVAAGFDGEIANVTSKLQWQGWGRVDSIDPLLPHIARVKGMDFTQLRANHLLTGFSTAADAMFNLTTHVVVAYTSVPSPVPDGVLDTFVFTLPDAPGPGHHALHPGILPSSFFMAPSYFGAPLLTDNGSGLIFDAHLSSGTIDYVTGVVTLVFDPLHIPPAGTTFSVWYQYYVQDMYRSYWTAYKGEREMVAPDGAIVNSYDEFAFAPAYKLHNEALKDVSHPATMGYRTLPTASVTGLADNNSSSNINYDQGGGVKNSYVGVWIRLGKSFYSNSESLGNSPAALAVGADVINVYPDGAAISGTTGVAYIPQDLYIKDRYSTEFNQIIRGAVTADTIRTVTSLPFSEAAKAITNATDTASFNVELANVDLENSKSHDGYLIPHPMGSKWTDTNVALSPLTPAAWNVNLDLGNQLVEVYDAITTTTGPVGIVVSQIPGSTPFPDFFEGGLVVESNQIHLGGMTDVYLKGTDEENDVTGNITCSPHSILDSAEVLASGIDGSTTATTSDFISPTLSSFLATKFSLGALTKSLGNLAVVLTTPNSLTPSSFRIIHNIVNGAKIDGTFSDTVANLEWRLIDVNSVSLTEPLTVVQQGLDLATTAGSAQVTTPSGFTFPQDPLTNSIYLRITESNADRAEYQVLTKGAGVLTLESPLTITASSVDYKIYIKQGTGADLPLVRIKGVSISGDDAGVVVPYKHPVDIISSSFTGLNDDPISDSSSHGTGTGTLDTNGTAVTFTTATAVDFVNLGIIKYDVLRMEGQDDPLRYFYVTGFANSLGTNDVLILDRAESTVTGPITSQSFLLGHPAVGTGTCVFMDPTFISVDKDAIFSYADTDGATYKFRPSPAESAKLFESTYNYTDVTISNNGGVPKQLDSTAVDFFKHDIAPGDTVQILSKVIESQNLSSFNTYNLAGKTLVISVNNIKNTVVFSGSNPRTLDDLVADVNRALQDKLKMEVVEVVAGVTWKLRISSSHDLALLDEGSVGILASIGFTVPADWVNTAPTTLVSSFTVDSMAYNTVSGATSIVLTATSTGAVGDMVFIKVLRATEQRLYPAEMVQQTTGLWHGALKLTSYDPFVADIVLADSQFTVAGHESLGYDVTVTNTNYTYSLGEECFIRLSASMLGASATSFDNVYTLPGGTVVVDYDRSQPVEDVQSYMLNEEVRVVCNNPLVRHFLPAYPTFSVQYTGTPTSDAIKDKISEYLATLYPNKPLEVFDLTTVLSKQGLNYVSFPQEASFLTHNESRVLQIVRSKDIVSLGKKYHVMGDIDAVTVTRIG